jgi:hypothetical protein
MCLLDGWAINIIRTNYPTTIWYLPESYSLSVSYPPELLLGLVLYSPQNLTTCIRSRIREKYIRVGYMMTPYPTVSVPFSFYWWLCLPPSGQSLLRLLPGDGLGRVVTSRDCVSGGGMASDESWLRLPPGIRLEQVVTSRDCVSRPGLASVESWLCLPPSDESRLCLSARGASPTRGWPRASRDETPARGWPRTSRDCVSRPGLASVESWLCLPPSGESRLRLSARGASPTWGWTRASRDESPARGWPRTSRDCVSRPQASQDCVFLSRCISHPGLASGESWLRLPPGVSLGRVMTVSPTLRRVKMRLFARGASLARDCLRWVVTASPALERVVTASPIRGWPWKGIRLTPIS